MSFITFECPLKHISEKDKNYNNFIKGVFEVFDSCSNTPLCLETILKTKSIVGNVDYPITNINFNSIAELCWRYGKKLWIYGVYTTDDNDWVKLTIYIDNKQNISIKEHWNVEEGEY